MSLQDSESLLVEVDVRILQDSHCIGDELLVSRKWVKLHGTLVHNSTRATRLRWQQALALELQHLALHVLFMCW